LTSPSAWAVVPAAGVGTRMGADRPKQYLDLAGRPVLAHALAPLLAEPRIEALVLVVAPGDEAWRAVAGDHPKVLTAPGGEARCHSVLSGLRRLADRAAPGDWVLVHDAARPCLTGADLGRLLDAVDGDPVGGLLAVPVSDTLKKMGAGGRAEVTVPREGLWRALTPQAFRYRVLLEALEAAVGSGRLVTDEAGAVEALGLRPRLVPGSGANIKITGPEDLDLARAILAAREAGV